MDCNSPHHTGYSGPAILCKYVVFQMFQGLILFFHCALVQLPANYGDLTLGSVLHVFQEYDWFSYVCKYKCRAFTLFKTNNNIMCTQIYFGELAEFVKFLPGGITRGILNCVTVYIGIGGYHIHLR